MTEPIHVPSEPEHGKEKLYRVSFSVPGTAPRMVIAESPEAVRTLLAAEGVDLSTVAEVRFVESYYPNDYKTTAVYGPAPDEE